MPRFVCIHGHFYQPPRENPWTGKVEEEKSAHPFHDWNERIAWECYAPNSSSPMLDEKGKVLERVNNYSWISFDFGPTLLRWLEEYRPDVHNGIVEADRMSAERFGGHGSAMAQVYNHMIMPLASPEGKRVQVRWGVNDFVRRFGRRPEGMWLPETAVDSDSLEALAEEGIKFTILSPHQGLAVRREGEERWTDVSGGRIDTKGAYRCNLPSGKSISLLFFDKGLSTALAFGNMLENDDYFRRGLLRGFAETEGPQLVNVAADGETFGHHRKEGHIVLTNCISRIEEGKEASMVNYGFYLALAPPRSEVRIAERTSWSCAHGVERWRGDCGCGSEIHQGYNQRWRGPLRSSLDWLSDRVSRIYAEEGFRTFADAAGARDKLPSVRLGQTNEVREYVKEHLNSGGSAAKGAQLLEMVECSALMFASCAWFWEDISRMETVQMLRFAVRATELAHEIAGVDLEHEFKRMLEAATPNDKRFKTGADLYNSLARNRNPS